MKGCGLRRLRDWKRVCLLLNEPDPYSREIIMTFLKLYILISMLSLHIPFSYSAENSESQCYLYTKCKSCGDEKYIKEWSLKKIHQYGDDFSIIQALRLYANGSSKRALIYLDETFFIEYGPYFLSVFIADEPLNKQRLEVIQYLLNKGVHPYDRITSKTSLAWEMIVFNDIKGFQLMVDSGKLNDCNSELELLEKEVLKKKGRSYFVNTIEQLKAPELRSEVQFP